MKNELAVKMTAYKVAFLMEHQHVLPDLKELIGRIRPEPTLDLSPFDVESAEYLLGAYDALNALVSALEEKGLKIK
jgi:hypothetical protein